MQSQVLSSQQFLKSMQCDTLEKVSFSSVVAVMDHMLWHGQAVWQDYFTYIEKKPKNLMLKSLLDDL